MYHQQFGIIDETLVVYGFNSPTNNSAEILSRTGFVFGTAVMYVTICLPSATFQQSVIFVLHLDFEITPGGIYNFLISALCLLFKTFNGLRTQCMLWLTFDPKVNDAFDKSL